MCKAKDYSEQLLTIFNNINEDFKTLSNELSQADLSQQDILHMIENENFNASRGYELAKMIHDTRNKRREIKNELEPLNNLKTNFINRNLQPLNNTIKTVMNKDNLLTQLTENKVYKPRVIGRVETINIIQTPTTVSQHQLISDEDYKLIHKKTGREIEIIQKVDQNLYLVKFKNSNLRNVLNKKNIINFDKIKLA